jgi:hypothetical protein
MGAISTIMTVLVIFILLVLFSVSSSNTSRAMNAPNNPVYFRFCDGLISTQKGVSPTLYFQYYDSSTQKFITDITKATKFTLIKVPSSGTGSTPEHLYFLQFRGKDDDRILKMEEKHVGNEFTPTEFVLGSEKIDKGLSDYEYPKEGNKMWYFPPGSEVLHSDAEEKQDTLYCYDSKQCLPVVAQPKLSGWTC